MRAGRGDDTQPRIRSGIGTVRLVAIAAIQEHASHNQAK
eukprot:SAG25_NODE_8327_length_427_cov_4.250000_1_plen_38_part_01